ncbi:MAG: hypothetical protein HQL12_02740 [Candidatus Omnitrophica bacterium]|nr:hypothetical protein [Candidatus Omnitrophota bacterium]
MTRTHPETSGKEPRRSNDDFQQIFLIPLALFFLLFFSQVAEANFGIPVLVVMLFPIAFAVMTCGLSLITVTVIEGLVLRRALNLGYIQAFWASFLANAFSTLLGCWLVFFLTPLTILLFIPCWSIAIILLHKSFKVFASRTGFLENFAQRKGLCQSTFIAIGVVVGGLASVIPICSGNNDFFPASIPFAILLVCFVFIASVIVEGNVIARMYPDKGQKIGRAALIMNIISYTVLLLGSGIYLLINPPKLSLHSESMEALSQLGVFKSNIETCFYRHPGQESSCGRMDLSSTKSFDYQFNTKPADKSRSFSISAHLKNGTFLDKITLSRDDKGKATCQGKGRFEETC